VSAVAPTDTLCVGGPVPTIGIRARLVQCILRQISVGNSPTLSGESEKAWFIWFRVQPPNKLAFWGSVGPRDLKPVAIRAGACVAARQPGWARRECGGPDGHAMCRRSGSNRWINSIQP
jgi:hypothetical protein